MKRLIVVLALLGSLLFAASASAHDANHDRIPDRWEKRHGLSLKVKQTARDQDKDGFKNRAEWRAKTDPRDADSDDDGVDDSEENAGTVTSFTNGELTITLFDGGTLTGKVTDDTEIECDVEDSVAKASHDPGDDDEHGDDDDERGDHGGRHDGDDRRCDDDGEECGVEALTAGRAVDEATLRITSEGRIWEEIELR